MLILYGKNGCKRTSDLNKFLESNNIEYSYLSIDKIPITFSTFKSLLSGFSDVYDIISKVVLLNRNINIPEFENKRISEIYEDYRKDVHLRNRIFIKTPTLIDIEKDFYYTGFKENRKENLLYLLNKKYE